MQDNAFEGFFFLYKVLLKELWDGIRESTEELLLCFKAISRLGRTLDHIWLFPINLMMGIGIVTYQHENKNSSSNLLKLAKNKVLGILTTLKNSVTYMRHHIYGDNAS